MAACVSGSSMYLWQLVSQWFVYVVMAACILQLSRMFLFPPFLLFISILKTEDIQGDSGGICTTLGDDSMSDSKQKSSYEHGSDF
jgi:hypothetical protein